MGWGLRGGILGTEMFEWTLGWERRIKGLSCISNNALVLEVAIETLRLTSLTILNLDNSHQSYNTYKLHS
jgi:hypothetical protein